MAEITREHLKLAALAAGHEIVCALDDLIGPGPAADAACGAVLLRGVQAPWRPHLDDGDAARLAVWLDMETCMDHGQVAATVGGWHDWARVKHDGTEPDKLRAWREAVVLCAAAVGERMRKGGA